MVGSSWRGWCPVFPGIEDKAEYMRLVQQGVVNWARHGLRAYSSTQFASIQFLYSSGLVREPDLGLLEALTAGEHWF